MARTKIDYGIDLGTTNSAIARMENGKAVIKKSLDTQKDTTPSAVSFNKKGNILVGDLAYRQYRSDSLRNSKNKIPLNSFVEFKRTMGTDKQYESRYADRSFTSEELSAEVLVRLKEYIQDETVSAAVITIPAAFKSNQIEATRQAATLAGLTYVEMLQEPIAAAMAYGISTKQQDGYWLVFDFGGGTFDAALLKAEDGILQVVDTEGDNYLGGKDLDYAIVDEIIIPHIQANFTINEQLLNEESKSDLRAALKFYAEEIKNQLSFNSTHELYVDPGDLGEDDEGEEIEIDLVVTQADLEGILSPIYQRAIDCSLALLKRNNLSGDSLNSLILVGGPTLSPIIREMLTTQICTPETSMDPMTVVSVGATLYASTVDLPEEIKDNTRDRTKVQLEVTHAATTVEDQDFVAIKLLPDKMEGEIPDQLYAEIMRADKGWVSGKVALNDIGDIVEVLLDQGKTNIFDICVTDQYGTTYECEPKEFTIIQGTVVGSATLPYNIGIEIEDIATGKAIFRSVKGLEKNKSLPAQGAINNLKTPKELRPGLKSDFIEIPIYQGEYGADGTRAIHNHHVNTIYITGEDIPSMLPKESEVDIILKIDRSQKITGSAYFPYLDYDFSFEVKMEVDSVDSVWLEQEFRKAETSLQALKASNSQSAVIEELEAKIQHDKQSFSKNKKDVDTKQQTLSNLRMHLKEIDKLQETREWPTLEEELRRTFSNLESVHESKGNEQSAKAVEELRLALQQVSRDRDVKSANRLLEEMQRWLFELERLEILISFIYMWDQDFNEIPWMNRDSARRAIDKAKELIYDQPTVEQLARIWVDLYQNGQFEKSNMSSDAFETASNILRG